MSAATEIEATSYSRASPSKHIFTTIKRHLPQPPTWQPIAGGLDLDHLVNDRVVLAMPMRFLTVTGTPVGTL